MDDNGSGRESSDKLRKKMDELSVVGFSCMGNPTADQLLSFLEELDRIRNRRRCSDQPNTVESIGPVSACSH